MNKTDVNKGDIFTTIEDVYIKSLGGKWSERFVKKEKYYIAQETARNNGYFLAKDSKGRLQWLNISNIHRILCRSL